jgi:hypothetical protein
LYRFQTTQVAQDEFVEDVVVPEIALRNPNQEKFVNIKSSEGPT